MILILSFCNEQRSPERGLAIFDTNSRVLTWTAVGADRAIAGTRGIFARDGYLYATYTIGWEHTRVATYGILGDSLQLFDDRPLPEVRDPHSICVHEDRLVMTSTGSDAIVSYGLRGGTVEADPVTLWCMPESHGDSHHVNAVCSHGGRLLASAFGPRAGDFWSSAHRGYVFDTANGDRLIEHLFQPHSLTTHGEELYVLESGRQQVRIDDGRRFDLPGYLRGLAFADGQLIVGSNPARELSRSRGIVMNARNFESGGGTSIGSCSLMIVNACDGQIVDTIDMSAFGREIYDVVALT